MTRKFDSWEMTECDLCEFEFQVTRMNPKEVEGQVICNDCEMRNDGFESGKNAILDEIESCECMSGVSKLLRHYGR